MSEYNQVIIDTPNKVWSTDITYIKLEKNMSIYLQYTANVYIFIVIM
jgi:hypothetical protein